MFNQKLKKGRSTDEMAALSSSQLRSMHEVNMIEVNRYQYKVQRSYYYDTHDIFLYTALPELNKFMQEGTSSYLNPNSPRDAISGRYHAICATSLIGFDKITGIVMNEDQTTADVDYTLLRSDITMFGEFINLEDGEVLERSASFQKYDDGWRLVWDDEIEVGRRDEYDCFN